MGAILELIDYLIQLYILAIFIYIVMSYFPNMRQSKLFYYLARICEPYLNLFRFATVGTISFAPMIATFVLLFIREFLYIIY